MPLCWYRERRRWTHKKRKREKKQRNREKEKEKKKRETERIDGIQIDHTYREVVIIQK